jgi:tetratricopeptide (TPR) repeat protein
LELDKVVPFELWKPECTGSIKGNSAEERRKNAEALATKINAHIVIYGTIKSNESRSSLKPEFYVNHSGFQEADEISGNHEFGSSLRIQLPINQDIPILENPALSARINALNQITIGLVYYSVDDYPNAIHFFEIAKNDPDWLDLDGKEIAYLLVGNSYTRLASIELDSDYLKPALENYEYSLSEINPNYGRAIIGYAGIIYLQALGEPPELTVNIEKLSQAESLLMDAMQLENQPESANIESKAHYYLGQINLAKVLGGIPGGDWMDIAKNEFEYVTNDYEKGDMHIQSFASHAYARLGIISCNQGDFDSAVDYVETAISIASPFYEGEYFSLLGNLYFQEGLIDQAISSYDEAIMIARSNSDATRFDQYTKELEKIKNNN